MRCNVKPSPAVLVFIGVTLSLCFCITSSIRAQRDASDGEWRAWGNTPLSTRYSPLDQITEHNVKDLRVVWRWPAADRALQASNPLWRTARNEDTPIMANGVLYTVTGLGLIAALDPATGQTRWVYDPEIYKEGRPRPNGFLHRGLAYWTDGTAERVLLGAGNADLISVDARTGKPDPAFGEHGRINTALRIRGAVRATNLAARRPVVARDIVIVGSTTASGPNKDTPPGYVQAFDIRTGKLLWTFHTVPTPGEFGAETWLDGSSEYSGHTSVWTGMSYDPDLDYVYLPISTATNDYYGGHRPGDNLFAESLVCLDAKTGKRVWHFQTIHHGLWDYDLGSPPVLGDITVNGRRIKAVMQVSKQAFTYVFDRATGTPVWPIEERPVPQSQVPGERTSPTQPFPTKPPPFDLQGATEDNLIDFTPELRKRALEQLQTLEHGRLFTPISSMRNTVLVPGIAGGANWGGAGFDPETGVLYVPSRLAPTVLKLIPVDAKQGNMRFVRGPIGGGLDEAGRPASAAITIDGLSIFKPPYSRVTAIDLNAGEHRWMAPLGNGPRNHPLLKDLNLPPLGDENQNGVSVLVTKTLLFVSARPSGTKWADADAVRKLLYVFDKQSGKLVRAIEMDGLAAAAPMTYLYGGKQYVVVATDGRAINELVAFSLPGTPGN